MPTSVPTSSTAMRSSVKRCRRMGPNASQQAVKDLSMPRSPFRSLMACLPLHSIMQTTTEVFRCPSMVSGA